MSTASPFQPRRSLIFVPADRPDRYPKALATGADVVCVDVEDAIAPQHKTQARETAFGLFNGPQTNDGIERVVRINSLRSREGLRDISAYLDAPHGPPVLMMTKVKSADEVQLMDDLLGEADRPTRLQIIIETNEALQNCMDIAQASDRIDAIAFGGVDMAAELRAPLSWDSMLYARSQLVHAAAAANIDVMDVPYLDLEDMAGLEKEARAACRLGFTGKAAIHPKQVETINRCFSPDAAAVDRARRIVTAFEQGDRGVAVMDGKLIEKPVMRSMQRIIALADRVR